MMGKKTMKGKCFKILHGLCDQKNMGFTTGLGSTVGLDLPKVLRLSPDLADASKQIQPTVEKWHGL